MDQVLFDICFKPHFASCLVIPSLPQVLVNSVMKEGTLDSSIPWLFHRPFRSSTISAGSFHQSLKAKVPVSAKNTATPGTCLITSAFFFGIHADIFSRLALSFTITIL